MTNSAYTYDALDQPGVVEYIFHPTSAATPCPAGGQDLHVEVEPGITVHTRLFPADKEGACLLFFHGNGEAVSDYDDIAPKFTQRGITFIAAEYRGYGLSKGAPTASAMMADCHRILDDVLNWKEQQGYLGQLLVMGRSLGSASAIELAHSHPDRISALLIDSGFALTMPLLATIGVDVDGLSLSEDQGFGNLEKIKAISMATYILHGQNDEIIALTNASELIAESPALQKEFQTVPGAGHNDIFAVTGDMYFDVMGRFINKIGKVRKKRSGVR